MPVAEKYDVLLNGQVAKADLTVLTADLTNLTVCTTYDLVVVAKKTNFTSMNSISYTLKTTSGTQGPVSAVTLSPISFVEMLVSITDIPRDSCSRLDYRVVLNDTASGKIVAASGPGISYSFTALEPSKQYVASVTVVDLYTNEETSKVSSQPSSTLPIPSDSLPTLSIPIGVKTSDVTQNSFVVSWTASVDDITGYLVSYGNGNTMKILKPTTRADLTGLIPCTKYEVSVRSFKDNNQSLKSQPIFITTYPEKPAAVTKVTISDGPDGSQAIITILDDSVKQSCTPWAYIIKSYSNGVAISSDSTKSIPFTISGLTPGSNYTFGVTVKLPVFGLLSEEVQSAAYTTISKIPVFPSGPVNLSVTKRTNSSVTIGWKGLTNAVSYTIKSNGVDTKTGVTTESGIIDSLIMCTDYLISVYGVTSDGSKSPVSKEITASTSAPMPSPVTSVNIVSVDSSQVIINVVDNNDFHTCAMLWYIVTIGKTVIRTSNKKIPIIDLVPNTSYTGTIVVIDINSNATSSSFEIPTFTATRSELPKPSAPATLTVTVGDKAATLVWSAGVNVATAKVVSYLIMYKNKAGDVNTIPVSPFLPGQIPPTIFTITNLDMCTEYTFSVKAVSDKDKLSDSSNEVTVKTSTPFPQPPSTVVLYEDATHVLKYKIKTSGSNECNKIQYSVQLYEAGIKTLKVDQIKSDNIEGNFTTQNITPGKKYYVVAKIQDTVTELYSQSISSDEVLFKGSNPLPGKVVNLRLVTKDDKSISLKWDADSLAKSYIMTFSASETTPLMKETTSSDGVLTDLFACTKYAIYVQAKGEFGVGEYSDKFEVETNAKLIYDAITSMKLTPISDSEIDYKIFDVPRYCGTFKYSITITSGNKNIDTFDTDQATGKLISLSPSTEYTLSVLAKDDKVAENISAPVKVTVRTLSIGEIPASEKTIKASMEMISKDATGDELEFDRDFLNTNSDAFKQLEGKTCNSLKIFATYAGSEVKNCKISKVREGSTIKSVDLDIVANAGQTYSSQSIVDALAKGAAMTPPAVLKEAGISLSAGDLSQITLSNTNAAKSFIPSCLVLILTAVFNLL